MNALVWIVNESTTERLTLALLHFLWQGSCAGILAIAVGLVLRNRSACLRYYSYVTVMLLMTACLPLTFCLTGARRVRTSSDEANSVVLQADSQPIHLSDVPNAAPTPIILSQVPVQNDSVQIHIANLSASADGGTSAVPQGLWPAFITANFAKAFPKLSRWVVVIYLCGVIAALARLMHGVWGGNRLKKTARPVTDLALLKCVRQLALQVGLKVVPQVSCCEQITIPLVVGVVKPIILLPMAIATRLTPNQLEALLLHELSHIRQLDPIVNLIQRVIEAVLFFHPVVWFLSRKVSSERENAVDDMVVAGGIDRPDYADALVRAAELATSMTGSNVALRSTLLGSTGMNPSEFKLRVLRLLGSQPPTLHMPRLTTVLAFLFVGASGMFAFSLGDPQDPKGNTKKGPVKAAPGAVLLQLNPPLVVGDLSKIDDPGVLLDQLAASPLQTLALMTGGGFMHLPGRPQEPWAVREWDRQFVTNDALDPRVRRLIEIGPSAAPQIHQRLQDLAVSNTLTPHLVIALRSIGTKDSIPLLIKFLQRDAKDSEAEWQANMHTGVTEMAVTSALWKLTGRKHVFTHSQWDAWWPSVETDFTVQRDRELPEHQTLVTADRVQRLVTMLTTDEAAAQERLISLGSAALPYLSAELSGELSKTPRKISVVENSNTSPQSIRIARVIDELGATDQLPAELRRKYFSQRFANANNDTSLLPVFEDAVCRALSNCSFADFCSICLETAVLRDDQVQQASRWMNINQVSFSRRFATVPNFISGDPSDWPVWNQVSPADDPQAEVAHAVPVIIGRLKDKSAAVRYCAAKLADIIGFCSDEKPAELVLALRDRWLVETDASVRGSLWLSMARFSTPTVLQAISDGLRSDRAEIISDATAMVDWTSFELNEKTRPDFERLVELTRSDNDSLRERAVRSLRGKAPSMLAPEFERLMVDRVENIRKECAMALRYEPDPKYADVLFKLADDSNQQVRIDALTSIGNLKHLPSMKRLVPHLRDNQVWGYAVSALAEMGGQDALPLMFHELESGNDVGGMVYQHLRRITGKSFDDFPAAWLNWWNRQ